MNKFYLYGGISLVAIIVLYFVFENKIIGFFSPKKDPDFGGGGSSFDENKLLSIAMVSIKSNEVMQLQQLINLKNGNKALSEDGFFGSKTEAALKLITGKNAITLGDFKKKYAARLSVPKNTGVAGHLKEFDDNEERVIEFATAPVFEDDEQRVVEFQDINVVPLRLKNKTVLS